ncbi:MAG: hypothetical protein O2837_05355 [Bacteroidetes bacterium]|nr:hypothetical protein [Bacteroidota bacterium]
MKISADRFHKQFLDSPELFVQLSERLFLKTEIDVVYTDFVNWERNNLLYVDSDVEKGKWKKLNCFEYVWVKLVEQLRFYGFTYKAILTLKEEMFQNLNDKGLVDFMKKDSAYFIEKTGGQLTEEDFEKLTLEDIYLPLFFCLLLDVIVNGDKMSILIAQENPSDLHLLSSTLLKDLAHFEIEDGLSDILSKTHVSISLSDIIAKFLVEGEGAFQQRRTTILSEEEHNLLKVIRNKPQSLKSIKIKYQNQKADLIEVSSLKKVELESRLMDHIQKGAYLNIEIVTDKSGIIRFENTKKIKL